MLGKPIVAVKTLATCYNHTFIDLYHHAYMVLSTFTNAFPVPYIEKTTRVGPPVIFISRPLSLNNYHKFSTLSNLHICGELIIQCIKSQIL